jgi:hypothetical protein
MKGLQPGEAATVTVKEWERILNAAAASVPGLRGRTAEPMSFMIRHELYQTIGLQPDHLKRIPFSDELSMLIWSPRTANSSLIGQTPAAVQDLLALAGGK